MKIKTAELISPALDWFVWVCAGGAAAYPRMRGAAFLRAWKGNSGKYIHTSTDWPQGGPIIERERIAVIPMNADTSWLASCQPPESWTHTATGPTPLVAAMRCYVASKLGYEVDVPEELT